MSDTPALMDADEITAAIIERTAVPAATEAAEARGYKYLEPLTAAADGFVEYVQNPEGRFCLGLHDIDVMTRGFGRGELVYVTGRAHSGKTQVLMNAIVQNPDRKIVLFTPDEVSELILSKLVSIKHGLSGEQLEQRIKDNDTKVIDMVRAAAAEELKNLLVFDGTLSLGQMMDAYREAEDWWGCQVDAVIVDFLELIPGEDEGVQGVTAKSQGLKRWTKEADVPVLCLHQASRSSGARGQSAGMGAMRYGGETEAIFVLEVYRKREDDSLDEWEKQQAENTVTVAVHKNKRPPCKTGAVDFFLHPDTGLIRKLEPGDLVRQPQGEAQAAWAARQASQETGVHDDQMEAF